MVRVIRCLFWVVCRSFINAFSSRIFVPTDNSSSIPLPPFPLLALSFLFTKLNITIITRAILRFLGV